MEAHMLLVHIFFLFSSLSSNPDSTNSSWLLPSIYKYGQKYTDLYQNNKYFYWVPEL